MARLFNWFRQHSLRMKLMTIVLLVILVMILFTVAYLNATIRVQLGEDIVSSNQQRVAQIADNLNEVMVQIGEDMMRIYEDMEKSIASDPHIFRDYSSYSIQFSSYYSELTRSIRTYSYIHSMVLLTDGGPKYFQSTNYWRNFNGEDLFAKVAESYDSNSIIDCSGLRQEGYYFDTDSDQKLISLVLPVRSNYRIVAFLIVNIPAEQIQRRLAEAQEDDYLILRMAGQDFLCEESGAALLEEGPLAEAITGPDWPDYYENWEYYALSTRMQMSGWDLVLVYSKLEAQQSAEESFKMILLLVAMVGGGMILISSYMVYEITDPLKRLTRTMETSEKNGSLELISFLPKTNDEVGILIKAYNKLIFRVRDMMTEVEREQTISKVAYLKTLQMQISPHFLYNALGTLRYLVEMQDSRAVDMVVALGDFYKRSLIGENDITFLREELEHVRSYLQIMKISYGSKFDYEILSDPSLEENVAVKLSLQPLVENAIRHGVKQKREKCQLRIRTYREAGYVIVEIYDNGAGIPARRLEQIRGQLTNLDRIQEAEHIGIPNVHQRIGIHFGDSYGLRLDSEEGSYTTVKVLLPDRGYGEMEADGNVSNYNSR